MNYTILYWLTVILATYLVLIFVALRFIAPLFRAKDFVLPKIMPEEIKATILDLESASKDQLTYLEAAYALVMEKNKYQWQHTRFQAALKLPRLFVKDASEIWSTKKFIYCTAINYILFVLLAGSKFFKREDVRIKHVFLNFVIHQYLQVKVSGKWLDVDPAGAGVRGKPLGQHQAWFG